MPIMNLNRDFPYAIDGIRIVNYKKGLTDVHEQAVPTILQEGWGEFVTEVSQSKVEEAPKIKKRFGRK